LFYEFPEDERTFAVDDTFMLGSAILVKPISVASQLDTTVMLPGTEVRSVWILCFSCYLSDSLSVLSSFSHVCSVCAEQKTTWFEYDAPHNAHTGGGQVTVSTPLSHQPVFLRGGSVVVRRDRPRRSSASMEKDPFTIVVALDQTVRYFSIVCFLLLRVYWWWCI
jgi:alpha 1,3-glucosidase